MNAFNHRFSVCNLCTVFDHLHYILNLCMSNDLKMVFPNSLSTKLIWDSPFIGHRDYFTEIY